jgi:hypothetical protein
MVESNQPTPQARLAKAIFSLGETLDEIAAATEAMHERGELSDELLKMADDIVVPLNSATTQFQRVARENRTRLQDHRRTAKSS